MRYIDISIDISLIRKKTKKLKCYKASICKGLQTFLVNIFPDNADGFPDNADGFPDNADRQI